MKAVMQSQPTSLRRHGQARLSAVGSGRHGASLPGAPRQPQTSAGARRPCLSPGCCARPGLAAAAAAFPQGHRTPYVRSRPKHPWRTQITAAAANAAAAAQQADDPSGGGGPGELELKLGRFCSAAAQLFPVWVVLGGALALWQPSWFLWFTGDWIVWGLALTMIGMGTSLEASDFSRLLQMPWVILLGVLLQYTVMPGIGAALAHYAGLPKAFAVGLVLVACCPGGTASNIVTFLARADVALSVGMTTVSTLLAAVTTPLLTKLAVGTIVPVNVLALLKSTCQVVLLPVMIGSALNHFFPRQVARTRPFSPIVAILTVAMICGAVVAAQETAIRACGVQLFACVLCLHTGGFALGYLLPKLLGLPEATSRTVSIEVGMQNSSLGSMLAALHFASLSGAAAPGAISACMHSVIGSVLAGFWRWRDGRAPPAADPSPATSSGGGAAEAAAWIAAWRSRQS